MEKSIKFLLFLLSSSSFTNTLSSAPASSHRTPRQLAHTALAVSAKWARDASEYFSKIPSARTVASSSVSSFGDCAVAMADSARQLQKSVGELGVLGPAGSKGFAVRMGNVQTWVSAALTDQDTCLASLDRSGAGVAVRKRVMEARRATSTALVLVNRIG